jgi:hypothetical protein
MTSEQQKTENQQLALSNGPLKHKSLVPYSQEDTALSMRQKALSPVSQNQVVPVTEILANTAHTVNLVYNHLIPNRNVSKARKMGVVLGSSQAT